MVRLSRQAENNEVQSNSLGPRRHTQASRGYSDLLDLKQSFGCNVDRDFQWNVNGIRRL